MTVDFQSGFAGQVAVIGGVDRCDADLRSAEDIDALVAVTGLEGIIPQVADESVGGEQERCIAAARLGCRLPNPGGLPGLRMQLTT